MFGGFGETTELAVLDHVSGPNRKISDFRKVILTEFPYSISAYMIELIVKLVNDVLFDVYG